MDVAEIFELFPTRDSCIDYLENTRWQGRPVCPYCNSAKFTRFKEEKRYHCNNCNTAYSVTVNTIFHNTHLALQKWFIAIALILNTRESINTYEFAQNLKVNKNTAYYLKKRIEKAMVQTDERQFLINIIKFNKATGD